jgi:hypothetical protein
MGLYALKKYIFLILCAAYGSHGFALATNPRAQTPAARIEGHWHGTLKVGDAELRLALHIARADDGGYKATMDSLDQGANGISVTSMTFKDANLTFSVDSIQGSYEGTLSTHGTAIRGTWSQSGQSLPLDFSRADTSIKTEHKVAKPSDIDGAWLGTIEAGAVKLRVVFHITNTDDGLTATMDSLDQGVKGLPATAVKREGDSLTIEMKQLGGVFDGRISKDRKAIEGNWSQGGATKPFALQRVKDAAELELRRPQNPTGPLPYRNQQAVFDPLKVFQHFHRAYQCFVRLSEMYQRAGNPLRTK